MSHCKWLVKWFGDGGFVETSGHYLAVDEGTVNTLAPQGVTGSWLLDPTNIYIALTQANAVYEQVYNPTTGILAQIGTILTTQIQMQLDIVCLKTAVGSC